jgi:hypothetical protein
MPKLYQIFLLAFLSKLTSSLFLQGKFCLASLPQGRVGWVLVYNLFMPASIESIDLHVRTYRTALKSNLEISVNSLINSHLKMESILHPFGSDPKNVDFAALFYCLLRLPRTIDRTRLVVMGQNPEVFAQFGFKNVTSWTKVSSPSRRRTRFFHPHTGVNASFLSSITDVDDIVNLVIAYQVEWNKFHLLLRQHYSTFLAFKKALKSKKFFTDLNINPEDWQTFITVLGPKPMLRIHRIYHQIHDIHLRLLAGSWIDYTKTVQRWWKNVAIAAASTHHLSRQNIYFVSSNSHSLLNLFTGFPLAIKTDLLRRLKTDRPDLYQLWTQIKSGDSSLPEADFLFYVSKFYPHVPEYQHQLDLLKHQSGILTIPSTNYLDINVQIFPLNKLVSSKNLCPSLKISKPSVLASSEALIFNIDYPLGFAAYHVLNEILENVRQVKGVYILGKAAVLNSELGDIEMPRVVFDEHTQNTYLFNNCFNTFFPFSNHQGSLLTNQKAVTVLGTFLENETLFQKYFQNNITVIEMESGPYLSAITEAAYDQQLPRHTLVDLHTAPFDVGIINYTSDTPYSQAKNLGTGALELNGAEPVYLGTLAILQRIINLEEEKK